MFALFHIKSGELIKTYSTEAGARTAMRRSNKNAGYPERLSRTWYDGYEMEWCRATKGALAPLNTYAHAPYGIMPYASWNKKFSPLNKVRSCA